MLYPTREHYYEAVEWLKQKLDELIKGGDWQIAALLQNQPAEDGLPHPDQHHTEGAPVTASSSGDSKQDGATPTLPTRNGYPSPTPHGKRQILDDLAMCGDEAVLLLKTETGADPPPNKRRFVDRTADH